MVGELRENENEVSVPSGVTGSDHDCKHWCMIGRPSLGMVLVDAADGVGLVAAFCASLRVPPMGAAMLVA